MLKLKNLLFTENVKDIAKAKKLKKRIQKNESSLRLSMWELVESMSKDESNKKLADDLSKSYRKNVTVFMRDVLSLVKRMK
jgi:diphthamide synthase subunit DPH2